jgi:hypothetical protein
VPWLSRDATAGEAHEWHRHMHGSGPAHPIGESRLGHYGTP